MFDGIIDFIGTIVAIEEHRFHIDTSLSREARVGDSVACSGICLTVIDILGKSLVFNVSQETLRCTSLGSLVIDSKINLEPSLKAGERISGHFVLGHVDTTVKITELTLLSDQCYKLTVNTNKNFMKYIASKGSVALDGVSLTVNEVGEETFSVNLLPYTLESTTFQYNKVGDILNMEIDVLARYACKDIT